jgi:hypothetical protein
MVDEKIWIKCTCGYEGYADMVEYEELPDIRFPTCPECGETVYDIGDEE